MAQKKMILDLDTGVDDALALALAVADPRVDLIGIVSSYGNNTIEVTTQNALDLLHLLGQDDVPVYVGLGHSSMTDSFEVMPISKEIHGDNGVGNVELEQSPRQAETMSGVDFIIQAAKEYTSDLIIVPTGPLTNLAAALTIEPSIAHQIGDVTLMGGALTVRGNVTAVTEANINQDPEAADYVFKHQENLTMVGLDVTLRTLLSKKETQQWRHLGSKKGAIYADIFDYYIEAYDRLGIDHRGAALHDPLAVGVAIDPTYCTFLDLNMQVTLSKSSGDYGRTIGDNEKLLDPTFSRAAIDVDEERYTRDFMDFTASILAD
ncbi:MAG: nucleoside hydrolase [Lactobacillaceae bacterium]|nr:nucleoside hydrolase [Lactobacillaceae bacterium]